MWDQCLYKKSLIFSEMTVLFVVSFPFGNVAECVFKIETILAIIFHSIYGAVCLQLTQFYSDDCENVYFIFLSSSNRNIESLTIVYR